MHFNLARYDFILQRDNEPKHISKVIIIIIRLLSVIVSTICSTPIYCFLVLCIH